jgi:hypothetical protein
MARPALGDDLKEIGFTSPEAVAATFVAADGALARFIGDGPIVTDDRPRIEYFNLYVTDPMSYDDITGHREPMQKYLVGPLRDTAKLQAAQDVVTAIWREHEASAANRHGAARAALDAALDQQADNLYLRYLRVEQQRRAARVARSSSPTEALIQ